MTQRLPVCGGVVRRGIWLVSLRGWPHGLDALQQQQAAEVAEGNCTQNDADTGTALSFVGSPVNSGISRDPRTNHRCTLSATVSIQAWGKRVYREEREDAKDDSGTGCSGRAGEIIPP